MSVRRLACLAGLLFALLTAAGCTSPVLDGPDQLRQDKVPLAPVFSPFYAYSVSDDASSWSWSSLFWLLGADAEADRSSARALPFWWTRRQGDESETTLIFPLYFGHTARGAAGAGQDTRVRFWTPFWGYRSSPEERQDWYLLNLFDTGWSRTEPRGRSGLFLVYDYEGHDERRKDFSLVPILGMAHVAKVEWGYPAEGVTVPALGREASRRWELLNLFGFITLFGYDDVGDRREWRMLTLFSNEMLSPLRSWRGRGDDPFVSEWVFPLYMNRQDEQGGWLYAGPVWGQRIDREAKSTVDWWLLGLVSRTRAPVGNSWKLLGFTVAGP